MLDVYEPRPGAGPEGMVENGRRVLMSMHGTQAKIGAAARGKRPVGWKYRPGGEGGLP